MKLYFFKTFYSFIYFLFCICLWFYDSVSTASMNRLKIMKW